MDKPAQEQKEPSKERTQGQIVLDQIRQDKANGIRPKRKLRQTTSSVPEILTSSEIERLRRVQKDQHELARKLIKET